jgi:UDP-glucuronate 4-epimerase
MKILVTGAAGFIGSATAQILLQRGDQVWGLDNLNDYYSVQLKRDRLARLTPHPQFHFIQQDLAEAVLDLKRKRTKTIHINRKKYT